jgi:hypothetical protein
MQVKAVHIVAIVAAAVGLYVAKRTADAAGEAWDNAWDSVKGGVSDVAGRLWNGPADAEQRYQAYLEDFLGGESLNPFVRNPHNVNPADLIPQGYRMNQWGGLERIGGAGASGSW